MGHLAVRAIHLLQSMFIARIHSTHRGPYIVVLTDRGRTLRFYQASQLRIKVELIREFLKEESWKETPPWSSVYSPGGKRSVLPYLLPSPDTWLI
jgi:hypothetical protein